ncbi:alpha/beta hydrolase family protein [Streptomyces sp. NBC_01465]|uniref:alpha/beta hydrolase family protein n=1 Tax=Streptomyces sp. NBC_01465 TaxID=2903878 RepID=UPI002E2EEE20|nr:dienelactone hydrolase family protein [Streptomyces sp. NBC_01465]
MVAFVRLHALICAGVLLAGASLTACGGDDEASSKPSASASEADDFGCLDTAEAKTGSVTFKSAESTDTAGFLTGSGTTGILLAHQADGDVCQWVAKARELGKSGYRVLAVNSTGNEVPELVGAAAYLRKKGVTKLLLMGASKGGTAVIQTASVLNPKPDAVVSLSGPSTYGSMDAAAAAPKLTSPVLYMAGENDTEFAQAAQDLHKASKKAPESKLYYLKGVSQHGVSLLDDPKNWATVQAFLKKYGS